MLTEAQYPRHDGGGERGAASPGDEAADLGREEVPVGGRAGRRRVNQTVTLLYIPLHYFLIKV